MLPAVPCCVQAFRCSAPRHRRKNSSKALSVTFGDSSPKGRAKGRLQILSACAFFDNTSKPELPVSELFPCQTAPKIKKSLVSEHFQPIKCTQTHIVQRAQPSRPSFHGTRNKRPNSAATVSSLPRNSLIDLPHPLSCHGKRTTLPLSTHQNLPCATQKKYVPRNPVAALS